jgi:ribosome-associated protein
MDIRKLQRAIVDGLEDVKAQDIVVFNTEHLSPLFERVIIASGTSNRQTKALASSVRDKVKGQGGTVLATEGADNGEWIIVDCGAAVAHILQPAIRQYYHLEEIWGGKPVNLKLASAPRGLVKASEPMDEDDDEAAPPPAPARRAAAGKSAAGKSAGKPRAGKSTDGKAASGRASASAAGKTAGAKPRSAAAKTSSRAAPALKSAGTAAKAPRAAKTAAKKTAVRKTAAAPARRAVAKKAAKSARRG